MANDQVRILRALYDRWSTGDFATADAFDPEVEFARIGPEVVPGAGGPGRWRGRADMWQAILDWVRLWDEFHVEAERFVEVPDGRVLVLSRQTAKGKMSTTPVERELAEVFALREGKIVAWDAYWDRADAFRAVALDPARSAAGAEAE